MKLRNTIFDSKSEIDAFHSLQTRWSPKLNLYPSLPFSKIVEIKPEELSIKEKEYFYKTNVDYTFCYPNGKPILSIEFDGMGGGFSRNDIYIQQRETSDPYRKLKLDFKLKIAKMINYPLIVISYEETTPIHEKDSLLIVDGIIGQYLSKEKFLLRLREIEKDFDDTKSWEEIEGILLGLEVESELENDPIAKKASIYHEACFSKGVRDYSTTPLHEPPLPDFKNFSDMSGIDTRMDARKNIIKVGCKVEIKSLNISESVLVRDFEGIGIFPYSIAENIARYLAFRKAYSLLKNKKI